MALTVRPRDAASLVLVRTGAEGPEVLMGRRRRSAAFAPDVFVFPGGRVDPADRRVAPARPFSAETATRLGTGGGTTPAIARDLANAAIRETFEETGLMLGAPAERLPEPEAWRAFAERGLGPDHAALRFVARAITPRSSPIRFHARFFEADAQAARGRIGGSGELTDLGWYRIEAALELPLIDVTEFVLKETARRFRMPPSATVPLFAYRKDRPLVRQP